MHNILKMYFGLLDMLISNNNQSKIDSDQHDIEFSNDHVCNDLEVIVYSENDQVSIEVLIQELESNGSKSYIFGPSTLY